jgi:hypothetical protein
MLHDLNLLVPTERFEHAMALAARDMGGVYDHGRGVIRLPQSLAHANDPTFPREIEVHYRKFPCGMMLRDLSEDTPGIGAPCVSFDVIPRVSGDPRRSRVYQSFQGPASQAKILFGKFLVWLKIVSKALHRYKDPRNPSVDFARVARVCLPETATERVARAWVVARR